MSDVTITVNDREFVNTLRNYVAVRLKEPLASIINRKLLFILSHARKLTPLGDRAKILSDLGATSVQKVVTRGKNAGKLRNSNRYNQNSSAVNIVQWRRRLKGEAPLTQAEAKKEAAKMTGKRLRAVGSLKAGWVKAIRTLGKVLGEAVDTSGPRVSQPGSASPAKDGWNPTATAEYSVVITKNGQKQIDPRVNEALKVAFDQERRSMEDYIKKKLQQSLPQLKP